MRSSPTCTRTSPASSTPAPTPSSASSKPASTARIWCSTPPARGSISTDRFKDQVRAFRIDPGPSITADRRDPDRRDRSRPDQPPRSDDQRRRRDALRRQHPGAHHRGDQYRRRRQHAGREHAGRRPDDRREDRGPLGDRVGPVDQQRPQSVRRPATASRRSSTASPIRNNGQALGYTPVMTDATRATTFDDLGSELNVFDTATNLFVYRVRRFRARPIDHRHTRPGRRSRRSRRGTEDHPRQRPRADCRQGRFPVRLAVALGQDRGLPDQPEPGRPLADPHPASAPSSPGASHRRV